MIQRYFFDLADEAYPPDLQGKEFSDVADARADAFCFVDEVFYERPELASGTGEFHVKVTGPNRTIIFTLVTQPMKYLA